MASSNDDISRRDFFNGMLLAAGGAAVGASIPFQAFASTTYPCDGPIGVDPRVLRGGNLRAVFNVGHWLRDGRLTFKSNSVSISPSPCDNYQGTQPILTDNGNYDVIIVGAGMSGCSSAFYTTQQRPGTKILILDGQSAPGGNANRDDASPIPAISSTGTAYGVAPYADFLNNIYNTTGVDWANYVVPAPFYSYFFDRYTPYVNSGTQSWNIDTYGKGLPYVPYPVNIVNDLKSARADLQNWYHKPGSPTDPADNSDPKYDYLSPMTFDYYLTQVKNFHPAVSDFYTRYTVDATSGSTKTTTAYTNISFLGAEYNPQFAFPGGNSAILRHIVKWLIPGALNGTTTSGLLASPWNFSAMDSSNNNVRLRNNCLVVRADPTASNASVVYFNISDRNFYRATAKTVTFAGQSHTARTACAHLLGATQAAAFDQVVLFPVPVAAVAIRSAAPVLELGYDAYYWGSQYWADFVVADFNTPNGTNPNRPTVLTVYGGNIDPNSVNDALGPDQAAAARIALLTTPFSVYEDSLRSDLNRVLAGRKNYDGTTFDFDRDVTAIYLYRWGHSQIYPTPGWPFAAPTQVGGNFIRNPSPRYYARQPIGRIHFGAQDVESSPANESAIGAGVRTSGEMLTQL